jgi:hypothetical protein
VGKSKLIYKDPNDCKTNLNQSNRDQKHPKIQEVIRTMFPGCTQIEYHDDDLEKQAVGVDASVFTEEEYQVEIKLRYRNSRSGRVYDDLLIEYVSNDVSDAPGWIEKETHSDYFLYLIPEGGRGYKLPVGAMQAIWRHLGEKWKRAYKTLKAPNRQYNTLNVPVPWIAVQHSFDTLLPGHEQLLYTFEPFVLEKEVFELRSDISQSRLLAKMGVHK